MAAQEVFNVLDPQLSRYVKLRAEIHAYLTQKYGPATSYKMTDFKIFHENDRWTFVAPEELSDEQINEMIQSVVGEREEREEEAKQQAEAAAQSGGRVAQPTASRG